MNEFKKYFNVPSLIGVYLIGLSGLLIPLIRDLLIQMSFFIILLTIVTLAIEHRSGWSKELLSLFSFIVLLSFLVEVVGAKTGRIFGWYTYGKGLGPCLMGVPPLIGANWLLLVYCTYILADKLKLSVLLKCIFGALLMTGYDWILEHAVLKLGFWHWTLGAIPVQNYLAWFVLALFFHALLRFYRVQLENKTAIIIFAIQVVFFSGLAIFM